MQAPQAPARASDYDLSRLLPSLPDSSFEQPDESRLAGWRSLIARGYRAVPEDRRPYRGRHSLFLGYFARNGSDRGSSLTFYAPLDPRRYRGRRIRVSVAARPEHYADGRAHLIVRAVAPGGDLEARQAFTGEQWRRYQVELNVPRDARAIVVAVNTDAGVTIEDFRIDPIRR